MPYYFLSQHHVLCESTGKCWHLFLVTQLWVACHTARIKLVSYSPVDLGEQVEDIM